METCGLLIVLSLSYFKYIIFGHNMTGSCKDGETRCILVLSVLTPSSNFQLSNFSFGWKLNPGPDRVEMSVTLGYS